MLLITHYAWWLIYKNVLIIVLLEKNVGDINELKMLLEDAKKLEETD